MTRMEDRWPFPVPRRTDAPWCSECGMTLPAHWPGAPCNEETSCTS